MADRGGTRPTTPDLVPYEIEAALIASVFHANELFDVIAPIIGAEHFGTVPLAEAWQGIESLLRYGVPVEPITLAGRFDIDPVYQPPGKSWLSYFREVSAYGVPASSPAMAEELARTCLRAFQVRELYSLSLDSLDTIEASSAPHEAILERAQAELARIADAERTTSTVKQIGTFLGDGEALMDRARQGGALAGMSWGFSGLDEATGGIQAPDLILVGGRPSMGKTSFALSVAGNLVAAGEPVLFFSMESSGRSIATRALARDTGVATIDLTRGTWDMFQESTVRHGLAQMGDLPFWIDDSASLTVDQILIRARRAQRIHGIKCVMVDHLGFARPKRRINSRVHEVEEICHEFRALAKQLNLPVILISQLSRNLESREDKRPVMADLRDSGAIEQDADMVIFIYRDEYYLRQKRVAESDIAGQADHQAALEHAKGAAEAIIAKQREGPISTVPLFYDEKTQTFDNP